MGPIHKVPDQWTHAPKNHKEDTKKKTTFDLITNTELNEGYHPSFLMNCAFVLFGYNNLGKVEQLGHIEHGYKKFVTKINL